MRIILLSLLLLPLAACQGLTSPATPTTTPSATITPTPTQTQIPPTATVTEIPYIFGIDSEGNIPLNTVDLMAQIENDIPAEQLAAEQAYLDAHPEILGNNLVGSTIEGQGAHPYRTLSIEIDRENILSIYQDKTGNNLYEIVFVQAAPDGKTKVIVHLDLDLNAQQHLIDDLNNPGFTARIIFPGQINALIQGDIDAISTNIYMNSVVGDGRLVNDPAFALSRQLVEKDGLNVRELLLFAGGYQTEKIVQQRAAINNSQFVAPYALTPLTP
jgi:hypothetical protein